MRKNEEILLLQIANTVRLNIGEISDPGLFSGKTGIALFFYRYSRIAGNQIYDKYAGELLDSV